MNNLEALFGSFDQREDGDIFDALVQILLERQDYLGIRDPTVRSWPIEVQTFYYPAIMLCSIVSGGMWQVVTSFLVDDTHFDTGLAEVMRGCLKRISAGISLAAFERATQIFKDLIESPNWTDPKVRKRAEKNLEIMARSFDFNAELVGKTVAYAISHQEVFCSWYNR